LWRGQVYVEEFPSEYNLEAKWEETELDISNQDDDEPDVSSFFANTSNGSNSL